MQWNGKKGLLLVVKVITVSSKVETSSLNAKKKKRKN